MAKADESQINVSYKTNAGVTSKLNIALIELTATSEIRSGENSGRILHHVNVVRDFKTVDLKESSGNLKFELQKDIKAENCMVIAFVQNASFKIISAAKALIE